MVFGYTPLDPLVVLWGTALAIWYLSRNAVKLLGFMPTALSLWFFIPGVTNLTLWQTVPLLLTGRALIKGIRLPTHIRPEIVFLMICLAASAAYALIAGPDGTRALIRIVYYLGIFATFVFAYEMGRKPEAYEILLKGLVVMGIVYASYGAYQVVAFYTGLPVRGIVYNASGDSIMALEGGLLRINSLANEPKRLGYVLFLSSMACIFLSWVRLARRARQLRWAAAGIFAVSMLTFSGSYFAAIAVFGLGVLLLYPSKATVYIFAFAVIVAGISILFPSLGVLEAAQEGYERRAAEVQIGLDGAVVYRQEFFAWDYLKNNPLSILTGVGLGQYYSVLYETYGVGAGINERGGLMPLNSNFLEMVFDLGVIASTLVYAGLIFLIYRLRRARMTFFCLSLLFLLAQSFMILNLLYLSLFSGVAIGQLSFVQRQALKSVSTSSQRAGHKEIIPPALSVRNGRSGDREVPFQIESDRLDPQGSGIRP